MSISASRIVSVTPRVISAGGTDLEIVGLLLTTNALAVFPGTLEFTSASAVGEYFGTDSKEYRAASKYFLGYDNSFLKPRRLHFARFVTEDIAGALIGGTCASLANLKAITDGSFIINIDGSDQEVSGLDFSECGTQSEIAEKITDALSGATVTYNSNLGFIVTSDTTGEYSSVTAAVEVGEGTTAASLGLTADQGATASAGSPALDPVSNMESIKSQNQNWVSFTTLDEADEDTIIALAEWVSGTDCEYLYIPYTTSAAAVNPQAATLPKALADYEGVMLVYGETDHAAFVMSIAASIDWNRNNGLATFAFKSQSGLAAYVTDDTTAANAEELKVNFNGRYATRNDDFVFFYQGTMTGGQFGFVDAFVGQLWLRNALQVSLMNGISQTARVPYTDEGYTFIKAWCMDPINRALVNGAIEPGVTLSESQRAQLISEIGEDVSDAINTDGYYLLVEDAGASVRTNRESPTLGIWYTYGGSIHKLDLPVTAVL